MGDTLEANLEEFLYFTARRAANKLRLVVARFRVFVSAISVFRCRPTIAVHIRNFIVMKITVSVKIFVK